MKKLILASGIFVLAVCLYACKKRLANTTTSQTVYLDLPEKTDVYYSGKKIVVPNQNEITTLGRVLFYDKHLSLNNAVPCASCHKQEFAFADDVAFSRGFENRLTGRNSMPIENLTFTTEKFSLNMLGDQSFGGTGLFWDGRENSLKNLVGRPLTNHIEMGIDDVNSLPAKLAELPYYKKLFKDAYGTEQISFDRISEAVAFFITSVKAADTRYDQYITRRASLTAEELHGLQLFNVKYNCGNCHRIDTMGYISSASMDIGLASKNSDGGVGDVTGRPQDMNVFRIPNLRNVGITAPYMHDGRFKTLHEVLDHYSSGIENTPNLNFQLRDMDGKPMRMNISATEKDALVAFLNTLTDYTMITDPKYSDPFRLK